MKGKFFLGLGFILLGSAASAQDTNHQNTAIVKKNDQPQNFSGLFKETGKLSKNWDRGTVEGAEVFREVPWSSAPDRIYYWTPLSYPLTLAEAREHCAKQKPTGMWRLPEFSDLRRAARSLGKLIPGSMPEYNSERVYKTLVDENTKRMSADGSVSLERIRVRVNGEQEDPSYLYVKDGKLEAFNNFQLNSNTVMIESPPKETSKFAVMCVSKTF